MSSVMQCACGIAIPVANRRAIAFELASGLPENLSNVKRQARIAQCPGPQPIDYEMEPYHTARAAMGRNLD
jgi:hypothetical protein